MSNPSEDQVIEVAPNQTIIEQGEQGNGFFVLQSGTLEVFKDGVLLAVLMYPGTIFGEMGDILGKPRTCTVRAKNATKVLHIAATDFAGYLRENPDIALKIIKTLASRLERTTQKLADTTRESPLWTIKK